MGDQSPQQERKKALKGLYLTATELQLIDDALIEWSNRPLHDITRESFDRALRIFRDKRPEAINDRVAYWERIGFIYHSGMLKEAETTALARANHALLLHSKLESFTPERD